MVMSFRYAIYQEISLGSVAVAPPKPACLPTTATARPKKHETRYLRTDSAWRAKNLENMRQFTKRARLREVMQN
eukprot:5093420-Pleurochrysis_carterae.AAC.1